jgi:hypothetical protein
MPVAQMGVVVVLVGSVLLLAGAARPGHEREDVGLGRRHRWFTIGGIALLSVGLWIRIASLSPAVGACAVLPSSPGPLSGATHCFHGAPWPPRGSSR